MRGNPKKSSPDNTVYRSIPARAGEPVGRSVQVHDMGVYPRACGGTIVIKAHKQALIGLSPRVRGNPLSWFVMMSRSGSIPARAGEPPQRLLAQRKGMVYPRACGGTSLSRSVREHGGGLSPRVRGNRRCQAGRK